MSGIERRQALTWLLWGVALVLGLRMARDQVRVIDRPANGFDGKRICAKFLR